MFVVNPRQPEWGLGQVQSVVGARVTVTFDEAGKMAIDTTVIDLDWVPFPRQQDNR